MGKKYTSRSPFALLGFLSRQPSTGYDISKMCEQPHMVFWSESYGQIYPVLKKLVDQGFATVSTESDGGNGARARKVYTITDEGRAELERWLRQPVSKIARRDEVALRVNFGANAEDVMIRATLELELDNVKESLRELYEFLEEEQLDMYEQMSALSTQYDLEARKEWLLRCLEILDKGYIEPITQPSSDEEE